MVLPDCVLLPGETLPLYIFEPRYRAMLKDVLEGARSFCVACRRPDSLADEPEEIACLGYVTVAIKQDDGTSNLQIEGVARVALNETSENHSRPYPYFDLRRLVSTAPPAENLEEERNRMHALLRNRLDAGIDAALASLVSTSGSAQELAAARRQLENGVAALVSEIEGEPDPGRAVDRVAATLLCDPAHRQEVLEEVDVTKRAKLVNSILNASCQR